MRPYIFAFLLLLLPIALTAQDGGTQAIIHQGVTSPQGWEDYFISTRPYQGVFVDVNTEACGFTTTPHYLVTLEAVGTLQGTGSCAWEASGYTAIYTPSPTGFRVYARWTDRELERCSIFPDGTNLTAEIAERLGYVIRWTAISADVATSLAWVGLGDILVFFGDLLVGFAYVWKRGDLDWVRAVGAEFARKSDT